MDISRLSQVSEYEWRLEPRGAMRVPFFTDESLLRETDEKLIGALAGHGIFASYRGVAEAGPGAYKRMSTRSSMSRTSQSLRGGW